MKLAAQGADTAIAINRLLKDGAQVAFDGASHVAVTDVSRSKMEQVAKDFGLTVKAVDQGRTRDKGRTKDEGPRTKDVAFHAPRIAMNPGRVVLFGLRPQHRAQTHATFPMLFNALFLSATGNGTTKTSN